VLQETMNVMRERLLTQPLIGILTATAGVAAVMVCWLNSRSFAPATDPRLALLALSLMVAVVVANRFPVHIRHNATLNVSSVPLYLMVVFLPPALAALVAGIAVLLRELSVHRMRRTYLCDLATDSGRWMIVALGGSLLAHIPVGHKLQVLPLAAAAAILWAGNIVTSPLLLGPVCQESPGRIIRQIVRDAGLSEGSQYLVGFVGAIAALHQLRAIALLTLPTTLVYLATKRVKEVRRGTLDVLESMADAVDLRDAYTGGHSARVASLVRNILETMQIAGIEADLTIMAARVHDIGKIGIPDSILNKAGRLTSEEEAEMRLHPEQGAQLLARYADFRRGVDMVQHHHEAWDGTGYPHRLSKTDIPLGARMIAVADSFDAMTSDRPYRRALSIDQATSILLAGRGSQWDPAIVDAFLASIADSQDAYAPTLLAPLGALARA